VLVLEQLARLRFIEESELQRCARDAAESARSGSYR
jgi:hypothetical protein